MSTDYRALPKAPPKPKPRVEPKVRATSCSRCTDPPVLAIGTDPQQWPDREALCWKHYFEVGGLPNSDFTDCLRAYAHDVRGPRQEPPDEALGLVEAFVTLARQRGCSAFQLRLDRHSVGPVFMDDAAGNDPAGDRLVGGLLALADAPEAEPTRNKAAATKEK